MAVAQIKRAVPDPVRRIELSDLVMGEANRAYDRLHDAKFAQEVRDVFDVTESGRRFVESCGDLLPTISALVGSGVHFDDGVHDALWLMALERLANPPDGAALGSVHALLMLPAVVLAYVMGVAGLSRGDWLPAASALARTRVRRDDRNDPLADILAKGSWFRPSFFGTSSNDELAPSRWITEIARQALDELVPDERLFEHHCLQFEYLLGLVYLDSRLHLEKPVYTPPLLPLNAENQEVMARIKGEVLAFGGAGVSGCVRPTLHAADLFPKSRREAPEKRGPWTRTAKGPCDICNRFPASRGGFAVIWATPGGPVQRLTRGVIALCKRFERTAASVGS